MIRERRKRLKEEKIRVGSAVLGGRMGGLTSEENYGRCGEQVRYAGLLFSAALALLEKLKVDSRFCPGEHGRSQVISRSVSTVRYTTASLR